MPLNTEDLERIMEIVMTQEQYRNNAREVQRDFAQLDEGISRISTSLQTNLPEYFTFVSDDLIQSIIDLLGDLLQWKKFR